MPVAWRTGAGWPPGWNWPRAICAWWPQRCRPGPDCIGGTKRRKAFRRHRKGKVCRIENGRHRALPTRSRHRKAFQPRRGRARCSALHRRARRAARRGGRGAGGGRALVDAVARFWGPAHPDAVRWVEVAAQLRLIESPLDIAQVMRERLLAPPAGGDSPEKTAAGPGRAWIFTSATLGEDEQLSWFTQRAGLQDAEILRVASPFDYAAQAAWYVP